MEEYCYNKWDTIAIPATSNAHLNAVRERQILPIIPALYTEAADHQDIVTNLEKREVIIQFWLDSMWVSGNDAGGSVGSQSIISMLIKQIQTKIIIGSRDIPQMEKLK